MASDTSLVFNLLGKDKISGVLGVIKNAFRSTAQTAEAAMEKASVSTDRLDHQIDETKRHLAELNAEFALTGDKTLFGKISRDRALLTNLQKIRKELTDTNGEVGRSGSVEAEAEGRMQALASAFGAGVSQLGSFGSTIGSVTSSVWGIVAALAALVAGLAAIGPGLALAGGAIGSLPALIGGGIAGIGALKLGLTGLSSEYTRLTTATGGGGGGAVKAQKDFTAATRAVQSAVEELARAERDVTTAQQNALAAQQAVTAARETASKRIRDESLSLESAQLDQKDSAQAVVDAQNALNAAKASGNTGEIDKAQEAYDRAVIAAQEATNKVNDLTEANKLNTKTGVEGASEVVQAKKQEADARQKVADSIQAERDAELRLQDARKSLADQQKQGASGGGGGGGAGQKVTQLAPAAREFLNTILGLRPAFSALRLDVQQKLFAGLAVPIQHLAEKWLPQLHTTLGQFASTFNGIARTAIATAGKKTFISDMAAGAGAVRKALGEIGKVAAGPLLDAFGRLARASAPFVQKLGHLLAGALLTFSAWIRKADEGGKLTAFFRGAADTLGKVWSIGGKVVGVVGQFVGIIFGQAKSGGDSVLDSANKALDGLSTWLKDPKNQTLIRGVVTDIEDWVRSLGGFIGKLSGLKGTGKAVFDFIRIAIETGTGATKIFAGAFRLVVGAIGGVLKAGDQMAGWFNKLPGRIGRALATIWDPLRDGFRNALNWIIGKWNNFHFTIGGGSFFGVPVPSATFETPDIPYLAKGGTATSSGMAVVGERGPELVSLQRGAQVTPLQPARGRDGVLRLDLSGADSEMKRMIRKWFRTDNLGNA